jgi:pimeloyl-ACP methyl ester carboxylesterase
VIRSFPALIAVLVFAAATVEQASAQDAVVFPDGFTLLGKKSEEPPTAFRGTFNQTAKLDFLNSGARFVFFSTHARKGAQVVKVAPEDKTLEFQRIPPSLRGATRRKLPATGQLHVGEFNASWTRILEVRYTYQPSEKVIQAVTFLSPKFVRIDAISHEWRQVYDPREYGPEKIRKLLSTHPDLTDGWIPVPDPMKRMTIAQFLKEVGWYTEARAELDQLKKDVPWAWEKEAVERFDKLTAEIDSAETKWTLNEVGLALDAGQYQVAGQFLKNYQPKSADAGDLNALAGLKARLEDLQPKYDNAKRLLRELIDRESGLASRLAVGALGGGQAFESSPKKLLTPEMETLLSGAEAVYRELHPDTYSRIERFVVQATQEEDRAKSNKEPGVKPDSLLALAVTGGVKGKNGASADVPNAVRVWDTRQMAIAYLRERVGNNRTGLLQQLLKKYPIDVVDQAQELAQIVTLLPPIDPENPEAIRGRKIDAKDAGVPDVYRIETGSLPDDPVGITYYLRLPREYHDGRSYPVILVMNDPNAPTFEPEKMVARLAYEADRRGYILAAPVWTAPGQTKFDYSGKDHRVVSSTIRDLSRKFQVDQDRVFAWGVGEGANFAFDLSMSRPDLLAGVVCMGPTPVHQFYQYYWKNAQKCPIYCVTGELAGSALMSLRNVYENWLTYGFYTVLSVYKGRGAEWFAAELPTLFDWMSRKTRKRGIAALRLDNGRFEPWQTCRETDNRFYWVGATELARTNKLTNPERPDRPPFPAEFTTDFRDNKVVVSNVRGAKLITVWLERDMIDWTKKLSVQVQGNLTGFKPQIIPPDISFMLEELYRTGDRKMLFFGKLEFKTSG